MNIWEIISIVSLVLLFVVYVQLQDIKSSIRKLLQKEKKVSANQENEVIEFPEKSEVIIGAQVWMTKNLEVTTFRNGDPIPQAASDKAWELAGKNKEPAWCYNGEHYGKLYNWYAVNDSRGLEPEGWHIPTTQEWSELEIALGEKKFIKKMKSTWGWHNKGNGTNSSGFSALPAGHRNSNGTFNYVGKRSYWWCAGGQSAKLAWLSLAWLGALVYIDGFVDHYAKFYNGEGLSVRCVKD